MSGSNSIFSLFYSIYLGTEIKNLEETRYYGRERIFFLLFGAEARLQPFCSSPKAWELRPGSLATIQFLLVGGA